MIPEVAFTLGIITTDKIKGWNIEIKPNLYVEYQRLQGIEHLDGAVLKSLWIDGPPCQSFLSFFSSLKLFVAAGSIRFLSTIDVPFHLCVTYSTVTQHKT